MKILQLCNKAPYPPKDGGAIAMLTISESFAELGHKVTVLAMNTSKHNTDVLSIPSKYSSQIRFKFVSVDTRIRPLKLIWNFFFSVIPYNAERFIQKSFNDELKILLNDEEFDLIQIEGLYLLPYIPLIRKHSVTKIAYRAHNIENEIWERIARDTKNPFKKYYLSSLAGRIKKFEKNLLNKYDLLIPITERDFEILKQMGNYKPGTVCPAGIPATNFKNSTSVNKPKSLFYIGALDWIPNQEAICWFLDHVWERVKEKVPGISLHIAGRNSPQWLQKKCIGNNIVFHGEIDDAHDFFDSYQIMIVPLFAGSGMRLKIVEAMARSKVVITTPVGAEGLETENGKHLLIVSTPEDFVRQIIFLLENKDYFVKIEKEAFTLANEKYNSKIIAECLIKFYSQQLVC
jgi:polysaccharide biosynthesis protein PslH